MRYYSASRRVEVFGFKLLFETLVLNQTLVLNFCLKPGLIRTRAKTGF